MLCIINCHSTTTGVHMPNSGSHTSPSLAFVDCESGAGAGGGAGQAQTQGRREVVVSGKRVKTIDVHAHCIVPEAMALMGRKVQPPTLLMSQPADRIRAMDEQGIDVEALS